MPTFRDRMNALPAERRARIEARTAAMLEKLAAREVASATAAIEAAIAAERTAVADDETPAPMKSAAMHEMRRRKAGTSR